MYSSAYIVESEIKSQHQATRYSNFIKGCIELNKHRDTSSVYTERHHIIPKSMGGSNKKDNIVVLTLREHFIAHIMLALTYVNSKMTYALNRFSKDGIKSSRLYEKYRGSFIANMCGSNNPMFGRVISDEQKRNLSIKCSGENSPLYGVFGESHPSFGHKKSKELIDRVYMGENNHMYGNTHSDDAKNKIRKGISTYNYIIDGVVYETLHDASISLGLSRICIDRRCKSEKYTNYIAVIKDGKSLTCGNNSCNHGKVLTEEQKTKIKHSSSPYIYYVDGIEYGCIGDVVLSTLETKRIINKKCLSDEYPNYNRLTKPHKKHIVKSGSDHHQYGTTISTERKDALSKLKSKWKYNINDHIYDNTSEALNALSLSRKQLLYRCDSDKYPNYIKFTI